MALKRRIAIGITLLLILTACGKKDSTPSASFDVIQIRQVLNVEISSDGIDFNGVTYRGIDCPKLSLVSQSSNEIIACDRNANLIYLLGPVLLDGNSIKSAEAKLTSDGYWLVSIGFDDFGRKKFSEITARVTSLVAPQNQLALSQGNTVITAPAIHEQISGGEAQITGSFTQNEAEGLAYSIKNREPLPDFFTRRQ